MVPTEEEGWFFKGSCHHLSVPNSTGTTSGSAWMYLEQVLKFWTKYPVLGWYLISMEVLHLEVAHIYTTDNSNSIIIGLTIVLIPVRLVHHYSVLLEIVVSLSCRMQRILASSVSNTSAHLLSLIQVLSEENSDITQGIDNKICWNSIANSLSPSLKRVFLAENQTKPER